MRGDEEGGGAGSGLGLLTPTIHSFIHSFHDSMSCFGMHSGVEFDMMTAAFPAFFGERAS